MCVLELGGGGEASVAQKNASHAAWPSCYVHRPLGSPPPTRSVAGGGEGGGGSRRRQQRQEDRFSGLEIGPPSSVICHPISPHPCPLPAIRFANGGRGT